MLTMSIMGIAMSYVLCGDKESSNEVLTITDVHMQGAHCTGTVGCGCTGFAPKTDGKEWQKAYCRKCGHKKTYHR